MCQSQSLCLVLSDISLAFIPPCLPKLPYIQISNYQNIQLIKGLGWHSQGVVRTIDHWWGRGPVGFEQIIVSSDMPTCSPQTGPLSLGPPTPTGAVCVGHSYAQAGAWTHRVSHLFTGWGGRKGQPGAFQLLITVQYTCGLLAGLPTRHIKAACNQKHLCCCPPVFTSGMTCAVHTGTWESHLGQWHIHWCLN